MDFAPHRPRRTAPTLLPMINVVFLLLIFFLISSRITAPDPFDVALPTAAAAAEAAGDFILYLAADGTPAYRDQTGAGALTALQAAVTDLCAGQDCAASPARLTLHADAALPAAQIPSVLRELSALGFAQVDLAVQAGGAE